MSLSFCFFQLSMTVTICWMVFYLFGFTLTINPVYLDSFGILLTLKGEITVAEVKEQWKITSYVRILAIMFSLTPFIPLEGLIRLFPSLCGVETKELLAHTISKHYLKNNPTMLIKVLFGWLSISSIHFKM